MKITHSGGYKENGVVVGNTYDKYNSCNPIVKWMMGNFERALSGFVVRSAPDTIHEIGCGEGYWVLKWRDQGICARGSDFSTHIIDIALQNAVQQGYPSTFFEVRSIYDLKPFRDQADLIVCCEVLEHLENPKEGLISLQRSKSKYLILSVPREPLWRVLNLMRGKYVSNFGNTPGHMQHWSKSKFLNLVSQFYEVIDIKCPIPWIMLFCRLRS